jgi:hypothetical protein
LHLGYVITLGGVPLVWKYQLIQEICLSTTFAEYNSLFQALHVILSIHSLILELVEPLYDKICMMTTRLACNQAIESSYWRMDNDSDVGLLTGYVLYWLLVELEFMDLDTFPH